MEMQVLEVLLSHTQDITAIGKEHISAITVFGHVLVLALLEVLHL
jgi:hypothetical protein